MTNEMNDQKKRKKLDWTTVMQEKFGELKLKFSAKPIRAYPRYDLDSPFQVTVDFSTENLGAVLSQVQEGQERMIAVEGRKTNSHEKNYGSVKGELAGLVYALRKWEHILRFRKFIVHTDSRGLTYLRNLKPLRGIWWRWLQEVSSYDFEIRHCPGKKIRHADAISRSTHLPAPTEEEENEPDEYVSNIIDEDRDTAFSRELLIEAQTEDTVLQKVRKWVADGPPSKGDLRGCSKDERAYAQQLGTIEDDDGLLVLWYQFNKGVPEDRKRALVPPKFRERVFY